MHFVKMPKTIMPNERREGIYTNLTVEEDGLVISGNYELLNLTGIYVPKGGVWATAGSSAKLAIFSGVKMPHGANLSELKTEKFHGQGIYAKDLIFRSGKGLIDLSAAYIEELTLQHLEEKDRNDKFKIEPYHVSLRLRDAYIEILDFGNTENSELTELDLRGACIMNVSGFMPAVRSLYLDDETEIPDKMKEWRLQNKHS